MRDMVESFRRGFATTDVELLTSLWASDDDALIYVAGERAQPLRRRHEIAQYYRDAVRTVETVETAGVTRRLTGGSPDTHARDARRRSW